MAKIRFIAMCVVVACGGDRRDEAPAPPPPRPPPSPRPAPPPAAKPAEPPPGQPPPLVLRPPPVMRQGRMHSLAYRQDDLVALSWDGVVSGNTEAERALNKLQIWEPRSQRVLATAGPQLGTVIDVDVATTANLAAITNRDGKVMVCTLPGFEVRWSAAVDRATMIAITGDGSRVVVGDHSGAVRIFDGAGQLQWQRKVLSSFTMDVAVSPSGHYFAIGGDDKDVWVFDLRTHAVVARLPHPAPNPAWAAGIYALAFAPDEKSLATAGAGDIVQIFAVPSGKRTLALPRTGQPLALAWSPDGKLLAYAGDGPTITLVTVATGAVARLPTEHKRGIRALAFSRDGMRLASGSYDDKTIRLWDPATAK